MSGRVVSDYEAYLFGEGHWLRAWEKMGARPVEIDGLRGYSFAVWAPKARRGGAGGVFIGGGGPNAGEGWVVGDFNAWDGRVHPMRNLGASGLWELFIPDLPEGHLYK